MRLLKAIEFLFLSFLVGLLTSDNISDIAREEQGTTLVKKVEPEASSPTEDLFPSSLQPITVQCVEDEMMIQVHGDLFQTGHFIQAKDLSIGPQACHYSVANESATLIIFKVELHECLQNVQVLDFVLYNVSLYYKPDSASNLATVKSVEEFPITCHYPWKNNASSNAIQTSGVPFTSAMFEEGKQYFSLRLMTDDWQAEKDSTAYFLGEDLHVQADIRKGSHLPLRLFIDTCMVTSKPDGDSDPQYKILDFHGCLIERDSHDVGPSFISPRLQLETLQFTIPASQIARDERSLIYIACHLKVTAAAQEPDFLNKACSFNRERKT
ncbi:zona pellucida sperm-binding protein 3-like [Vipera latastei]